MSFLSQEVLLKPAFTGSSRIVYFQCSSLQALFNLLLFYLKIPKALEGWETLIQS